ncbi:hypothetical protein BBO99_00004094 [Phytophthora kernoviae]|uniref:Potassium channel domain-containing protein n=2 Tax=Phytophthora kernoviae TaxID=325452 RepID=A0A3R7KKK2_9STRA|nr:hypothetical protein G195_004721 [Phytophthora kernoviae 00238/432]KAG2526477.1 hypothetical protein JM16_002878 [Phytophthora kernoviae]KAG2527995.1 hypothetical protein JM18_003437 [Phytophthora kernoviae]RLN14626.1 hypothetical protein BBI17_004202 [Phytophthora kernoviae]RLN81021.1 hypothetical protein BBO99_00004094 [Phytophthora kernoviae]
MGMICVNQNEENNATTSTPRCVADWAHTQEQVTHAAYLLAGLVVVAFFWTLTSRRQRKSLRKGELGFSLNCRRWARTSRAAAIINRPVQLLVSFAILGFTMSRLNSYDVTEWSYYTVLGLYAVAIVDDVVRFLASRYKLLFCFSPFTLLELLCLASNFGVGFGTVKVVGGVRTRTYLDFSIMRSVFILRSYLEMEKHVPKSTKGLMMVRLGIKILLMIMVGASIMFFLETLVTRNESSECSDSTWSIMFAFYFTVVTLGTVGYGDNAPHTVPSRLLAIMFIVMGIILFSMEIDNLIDLYKLRQIGNPPYAPKPDSKHLTGDPASEDAMNIMRVLATKRYVGASVRFLVMVLRAESARHMLAAGVDSDDVICENVVKMGSLAQNAVANGISTMLSNLGSSLSVDSSEDTNDTQAPLLGMLAKDKSMGADILSKEVVEKGRSGKSWIKEYYAGAAKEMYLIRLSKKYSGMTFSQAASTIFRETSGTVLLIGVEVIFSDEDTKFHESESRVLLNPGESLLLTEWVQCYVIADDLDQVFNYRICPEEIKREDMERPGSTSTILNQAGDVFHPSMFATDDDGLPCDELRSLTAYTAYATPNYDSMKHRYPLESSRTGSLVLDRSLESIALSFKKSSRTITSGNPYETPTLPAGLDGDDQVSFTSTVPNAELETSIADAEAIFATMLVELKMDFSKIFTVTELADEANSKFMGMSFQLNPLQTIMSTAEDANAGITADISDMEVVKLWENILKHDAPEHNPEKEIFGLPLYMSGRILHPELCENMVVQTYFNPSIHKIARQLVGGPRCTGMIHTFSLPRALRDDCTYADVFHAFTSSSYSGICVGIYRMSTQAMGTSNEVELPIVITTPKANLEMLNSDRLFILIGAHTLERAARRIQTRYRRYKGIPEPLQEAKRGLFV